MKRNVIHGRVKPIRTRGKFKRLSSVEQFTEVLIKARPGKKWAKYIISFVRFPVHTVGFLAKSACIRKMRTRYMLLEWKRQFRKTAVKRGNNGIQLTRQVIGRMVTIMH